MIDVGYVMWRSDGSFFDLVGSFVSVNEFPCRSGGYSGVVRGISAECPGTDWVVVC